MGSIIYAGVIALGMCTLVLGVAVNSVESSFSGDFENPVLRKLILTSPEPVAQMVAPLRQWAAANGYKFRVTSPTGEAASILIEIWNGTVVIIATDRLGNGGTRLPGLNAGVYWDNDDLDVAVLDKVTEQIRDILILFGPVEVSSAPLGTPPRKKNPAMR